jgi:hypothetical protein
LGLFESQGMFFQRLYSVIVCFGLRSLRFFNTKRNELNTKTIIGNIAVLNSGIIGVEVSVGDIVGVAVLVGGGIDIAPTLCSFKLASSLGKTTS